jgi:hypothetical protein
VRIFLTLKKKVALPQTTREKNNIRISLITEHHLNDHNQRHEININNRFLLVDPTHLKDPAVFKAEK